MKKLIALFASVFLCSSLIFAQAESEIKLSLSDDAKQELCTSRHPVAALTGTFGALGFIGGYNRFVSKASWAKVNFDDVTHFYEKQIKWDRDWYWTNFVLHPYQGSLAYMSAKSSGFTAGESFLFSIASSAIWEWFFEKNAPSKNDMLYTSLGAIAVGEMFNRFSLEASGEANNAAGYLFNPMRLITQPISGHRTPGSYGNIYEMTTLFALGSSVERTYFEKSINGNDYDTESFPVYVTPEINVIYNNPYGHDSNTWYSQFDLRAKAAVGMGSGKAYNNCEYYDIEKNMFYDISIFSNGMLFARAPDFGDNKDTTVGMSLLYDFVWNNMVELSSIGPAFAFKQRIMGNDGVVREWQAHLGWAILGTSDYYFFRRNYIIPKDGVSAVYNYNTGVESYLFYRWTGKTGKQFSVDSHLYALYDFEDQLQDNARTGVNLVEIIELSYSVPVSNKVSLGVKDDIYMKQAFTKEYPDFYQVMNSGYIFFKLKLK